MGKASKRRHMSDMSDKQSDTDEHNSDHSCDHSSDHCNAENGHTLNACDGDEDSGFDAGFGSVANTGNHTSHANHNYERNPLSLEPRANKMLRSSEPFFVFNAKHAIQSRQTLHNVSNKITYDCKSKNGKYELKILSQPEEQHRARYLTEGSRGAIKDRSGLGHPIVKLYGYNREPVSIQCFIGHDKQVGSPHLFYQASKISGKNSTRCVATKTDATAVIVMSATPDNDMQVTVDCVGILKERNVDVEQKLIHFKNKTESNSMSIATKKRSTRCRLVFRCQIPNTNEILQVVSSTILCTQPLGTPEISKKSLSECHIKGGHELFIIGKNFLKDAKVVWKQENCNWTKVVEPDKEFLHSTHLICTIPCYDGPDLNEKPSIDVSLMIKSGGKYSEAHNFAYIKSEKVNAIQFINGTAQLNIGSTSSHVLLSSFEKPIVLTMIGTAVTNNNISNTKPTDTEMVATLLSDGFQSKANNDSFFQTAVNHHINDNSGFESPFLNTTVKSNPTVEFAQLSTLQPTLQSTPEPTPEPQTNQLIESSFKNDALISDSMLCSNGESSLNSAVECTAITESQFMPIDTFNAITPDNSLLLNHPIEIIPPISYHSESISKLLETPIEINESPAIDAGIDTQSNISLVSNQQLTNESIEAEHSTTISPTNSLPILATEPSITELDSLPQTVHQTVTQRVSQTLCPTMSPTMCQSMSPTIAQSIVPSLSEIPTLNSIISAHTASDSVGSVTDKPLSTLPSLPSLASVNNTGITQASNISVMSEMSDAELLCFINPSAFDQYQV